MYTSKRLSFFSSFYSIESTSETVFYLLKLHTHAQTHMILFIGPYGQLCRCPAYTPSVCSLGHLQLHGEFLYMPMASYLKHMCLSAWRLPLVSRVSSAHLWAEWKC